MTALTTTQFDELEANARGELTEENRCVPIDADITLQLVAIARAALAWSEARAAHREACEHSLAIDATLPTYQSSIDVLYKLMRGTP